jgi:hypothetical protein
VGTWFPGGGAMGSEGRPAFVPSEICRFFNTTGERLLQQVFLLFLSGYCFLGNIELYFSPVSHR